MSKKIETFIEKYSKDVLYGNGAIFIGSGISCKAGYLSWKAFLEDEAKLIGLDVDKEKYDLISLAQFIENELKRTTISNKIKKVFGSEKEKLDTHLILSSLPINTYWTTNYDSLIERTFEYRNIKYLVYDSDESLSSEQGDAKVFIYKMHGTFSKPKDAVITKNDYERYNATHEMFLSHLKTFLSSKTFLFIGYSFSDPNISYVLSRIKLVYKKNRRNHYWIFKKPKREENESLENYNYKIVRYKHFKKDIKNYGINIIEVDDYSELDDILIKIRRKVNSKNVLISGSMEDGNPRSDKIFAITEKLAEKLIENGYKIYNGFGKNIGSYVVKGAFKGCEKAKIHVFNDFVKLFPFPYNADFTEDERKRHYTKLRYNMIAPTGSTIVICGEKWIDGKIHSAGGAKEEIKISKEQGNFIIPIPETGGTAAEYAESNNIMFSGAYGKYDIEEIVNRTMSILKKQK